MLHKNIRILTWFNFFTDFRLYSAVAIIYFSKVSGSYALGMSIFAVSMISSALFEIPTGIFSDFVGRRKTMMLGAASAVIYAIFYSVGYSYWILVMGAVFEGLSRAFYSGNDDALLHESLTETGQERDYDEYLGKVSAMFQFALAISAILGSLIASWSFSLIMWLSVIPQILCFILASWLVEPKKKSRDSTNIYDHLSEAFIQFVKNRKLRILSISSVLGYAFGEASYQFQSAFYITIWPLWAIGIAKTLSNVGAAFSFHFSGRLIKKWNGLKLLLVDNIYCRIVNIFSVAFPSQLSPILMSTTSVFYGVTSVVKNTLLQKEYSDEQRATMGSLNSFLGSMVFGVVSISLGFVADIVSPAKAFLGLQLFQLVNLWFYWKLFKSKD